MTGLDTPLPLAVQKTSTDLSQRYLYDDHAVVHELAVGDEVHRSTMPLHAVRVTGDPRGDWWAAYLRGGVTEVSPNAPAVRTVELFSASGGLALGFSQACRELGLQMRSIAAVDQDEDALAIYRRHNATRLTSNRSVSNLIDYRVRGMGEACRMVYEPELVEPGWAELVGQVDVVLAGPPCQGHSNLNNRTRRADTRNELYLTVPAIAIALRAPVVVIENVQAAIHDRKQVVQSAVQLLRAAGYHVTTGVLKAAALGWPQRRNRFFVVARLDRSPFELAQVSEVFADEPRSIMWAIGDLEDTPADDFMSQQPEFSAENRRRIDWLFDNDAFDLPYSERPDCHKDGTTYNSVYGRLRADQPAPTITTGFMTPGRGRYIHPTRRRVLTPREAARLQGFPDTYDFRPTGSTIPSKAKLSKWIGDAVPMPLGHAAGIAALGPGRPALG